MSQKITAALAKLDPANDNHWTADGAPRIEAVRMISGDQTISRDDITQAAPMFTRSNAMLPSDTGTGETQAAAPAAVQARTQPENIIPEQDEGLEGDAPDQDDVEAALANVRKRIEANRKATSSLHSEMLILQQEEARLYDLSVENHHQNAQKTIQEYLANQRRINAERVRQALANNQV